MYESRLIDTRTERWYHIAMTGIMLGRPKDMCGRTEREVKVYDFLDGLGIGYERIDHEAVETMEACREIDELLAPAAVCKNLFLTKRMEGTILVQLKMRLYFSKMKYLQDRILMLQSNPHHMFLLIYLYFHFCSL